MTEGTNSIRCQVSKEEQPETMFAFAAYATEQSECTLSSFIVKPSCTFIVPQSTTLWDVVFGGTYSTCDSNGDPAWMCPAAVSTYYADIGGTDADIIQSQLGGGERNRLPTHIVQYARKLHLCREKFER